MKGIKKGGDNILTLCRQDIESILSEYAGSGCDPADIILDKSRRQELANILFLILSKLPPRDRYVLWYHINGFSLGYIAQKLKIKKPNVYKRLKRLPAKIQAIIGESDIKDLLVCENYCQPGITKPVGFPFELLRAVNNGGQWKKVNGRKQYVSSKICKLPLYFTESFGDNKTICPLCKRCSAEEDAVEQNRGN